MATIDAPARVALTGTGLTYRVGGTTLISNVDVEVVTGELLALVGPNGAGKSTLLALLAGDIRPDDGQVRIGGDPIDRLHPAELARRRAVMPQQSVLQFAFTVAEVVEIGTGARVTDPAAHRAAIGGSMSDADVAHLAARAYPTLSGGEQARTTFARVLAQRAPVLLLDEPTAHLDLRHQHLVLRRAKTLAAGGHAVAVVLHDLNLAARWADRVAVMSAGSVAATGTPAETLTTSVLSQVYQHPIVVVAHPVHSGPLILPHG